MRKLGWKRFIKLKYLLLLRSPGGAKIVANGFVIGLVVEFITLLTLGVAFLMIFPLCKIFKGSIPASMIGFLLGKLILPFFMPLGIVVGKRFIDLQGVILPWVGNISKYLNTLLGMLTLGMILGALCYFPIYFIYRKFQQSRIDKRKKRHEEKTL